MPSEILWRGIKIRFLCDRSAEDAYSCYAVICPRVCFCYYILMLCCCFFLMIAAFPLCCSENIQPFYLNEICFVFSSRKLKAQTVSFSDRPLSVVRSPVFKLLHFQLLLQNHWTSFNQT
jgi:hypothetical protein